MFPPPFASASKSESDARGDARVGSAGTYLKKWTRIVLKLGEPKSFPRGVFCAIFRAVSFGENVDLCTIPYGALGGETKGGGSNCNRLRASVVIELRASVQFPCF